MINDRLIRLRCSGCGNPIRAKPELAGKQVACPNCNTSITIPPQSPPIFTSTDEKIIDPLAEMFNTIQPFEMGSQDANADPLLFLNTHNKPALPQKKSHKHKLGYWIKSGVIGVVILVIIVIFFDVIAGQSIILPKSNKNIIRNWLNKNLNDSKWEEVEWFDPIPLKDCYFWEPSDKALLDIAGLYKSTYWTHINSQGYAIRLKFRTKNYFGANALCEKVFVVVKGEVIADVEYIAFRPISETVRHWLIRSLKPFPKYKDPLILDKLQDEMMSTSPRELQIDEWISRGKRQESAPPFKPHVMTEKVSDTPLNLNPNISMPDETELKK
jgi:hypothetical protein